ncbi:hypothetical protein HYU20_00800 [Candidatus Woesearchaeota archaeon]|nr:hypothetical protein [Candidatus Woesearchaeota archaeon]
MAEELKPLGLLKKYKFADEKGEGQEKAELVSGVTEPTGYPSPQFRYRIVVEAIQAYLEATYYWTLDELEMGWSFNKFDKITDIHAASEQSAFFGVSEQRLGLQQDKAAQYLRGISEMLKALFQIVRELRVIDERMGYYRHTFNRKSEEESVGSDITLKGVWVDQVEGGTKNAASVYGLAQTVGFSVLPDLFFRIRANDVGGDKVKPEEYDAFVKRVTEDVDKKVKGMEGFNEKVKEVVTRKLTQYYMWKLRTFKELDARRKFTIKYLRQHYDTIKLYMGWIKPYLRNILKLQMAEKLIQGEKARELITAFEGSLIEVEVLSYKHREGRKFHPCVLLNIFFRTTPSMVYVQEGYQRGPSHTGKFDMTLRGYVWSDEQIQNYKRMREEEDLHMLSMINEDVKASMDALGSELKQYLKEAGEMFPEDEQKKEEPKTSNNPLEPFLGVFGGLKDIVSAFGGVKAPGAQSKQSIKKQLTGGKSDVQLDIQIREARDELKRAIWNTYKNYKKLHGMLTW